MAAQTFPALYLTPVKADEVNTARRIALVPGGEPVVVGRIMGDTGGLLPGAENVWFASCSLSRKHAEIYLTANNEFMVRDTGSVNGTYVNGRRLSEEGKASESVALKTGDILLFGVDIPASCVKIDMTVVCAHNIEAAQAAGVA